MTYKTRMLVLEFQNLYAYRIYFIIFPLGIRKNELLTFNTIMIFPFLTI